MSDVNISTSWSSLPSSDTEYNTVLGVAGYDTDDERLFLSAQQVPGIARNVTTEYARGFRITSGYDGIVLHDAITETAADLKTVRLTMSIAGSAYDLEGARLYAQFKNLYSVDISSWTLYAEADDETQTLIASGSTITSGSELQVDFLNDYGAVRFKLVFEYTSGKHVEGWNLIKLAPTESTDRILGNWNRGWTITNNTDNNIYFCAPRGELVCALPESNSQTGTILYELFNDTGSGGRISSRNLTDAHLDGTQLYYSYAESSIAKYPTDNPAFSGDARTWVRTINEAGGLVAGGLNTADLSSYTGDMWQCRLIANIAAISPGPMATESEGGTEGDFDISSDNLDVPDLPAEGIAISPRAGDLYLMTESQFGIFQNAIYGKATDIRDIFQDITNCILSVMTFPLPTSAYTTRFNSNVFAGGQDLGNSTECAVINRYIEYDCGTVDLNLFWDSALDLNPYTKLNIFIPAVGMRPIDADCCMGHTIGLKYHIDLLTGTCVAFVTVDGDVYQQHTGNIGQHMAFSGTNNGLITSGILSGLAGNAANISENSNPIAGAGDLVATTLNAFKVPRSVVGNFSGNTAQLAVQKPYIEIIRPIQQLPRDYTKFNAYPCYMTAQLVNLTGWTEVQDIYIDDIDCTQSERDELLNLLHNGVIL